MRTSILFLLVIVLYSCKLEPTKNNLATKYSHYVENVEIIRDDFGVPHIYRLRSLYRKPTQADIIGRSLRNHRPYAYLNACSYSPSLGSFRHHRLQ